MQRFISVGIITVYLFLSIVMGNIHNHPISQGESNDCPAYVIGLSFNSATPADFCASLEYQPSSVEILPQDQITLSAQSESSFFDNRAPPQLSASFQNCPQS